LFPRAVAAKARFSTVHILYLNPYDLYYFHNALSIGPYLQ
jgi:hypothetical protein